LKYPEYLSAAKRHNQACRVLQVKIESCINNDEIQDDNFRHLIVSLYYLSGYIIECSLKYKIFELLTFDVDVNVDKVGCRDSGLIIYKKIAIHDFARLQEQLTSQVSDLSYESLDDKIALLLEKWNPAIRYEEVAVNYQDVKALYLHTKSFLRRM
jgi:hypothetical protein